MTFRGGATIARDKYLDELEAESIYILREAVACFTNPVLLYSMGKDSTVLLHLLRKAVFPAKKLPCPLLHIDTGWKFSQMIEWRDKVSMDSDVDLWVHVNTEAGQSGVSPLTSGAMYTHLMKTVSLKQAMDRYGFDAAIGGSRREEEPSRAKERVFSLRGRGHVWDPRNQRPELWRAYNASLSESETMRVFPLSNWTEIDVWRYIRREALAVVPLYFAAYRPVLERERSLFVVDDHRLVPREGERVEVKKVRFRTLGCYPLTSAVESTAANVDEILIELAATRWSERQGRLIDRAHGQSMEAKKREGYF